MRKLFLSAFMIVSTYQLGGMQPQHVLIWFTGGENYKMIATFLNSETGQSRIASITAPNKKPAH